MVALESRRGASISSILFQHDLQIPADTTSQILVLSNTSRESSCRQSRSRLQAQDMSGFGVEHTAVVVGYQSHDLTDISTDRIVEQVLKAKETRVQSDPRHTEFEDSELPQTPDTVALIRQIDGLVAKIDSRLERHGLWAHVLAPGEATTYHTHSTPSFPGLGVSWVYYLVCPEDSGDLIFVCQVNERRVYHTVVPKPGRLIIFSAELPHMTPRHSGAGLRISISGNHFLPTQVQYEINMGRTASDVSFFNGT